MVDSGGKPRQGVAKIGAQGGRGARNFQENISVKVHTQFLYRPFSRSE